MAKKKDLKQTVEDGIQALLEDKDKEPSDGRLKALALGIKMCALNAKLEENDYGEFFRDDDTAGGDEKSARPKSGARRGANGSGEPAA